MSYLFVFYQKWTNEYVKKQGVVLVMYEWANGFSELAP